MSNIQFYPASKPGYTQIPNFLVSKEIGDELLVILLGVAPAKNHGKFPKMFIPLMRKRIDQARELKPELMGFLNNLEELFVYCMDNEVSAFYC